MENPRLTFMTPTVIAGDKSQVAVLAHELAHSWSGNLVTNATWRDGWLNEGFTTYFERRIMEAVYGEERARLEWGVGQQDLRRALAELKPDEAWQGALAPDLSLHKGRRRLGRGVREGRAVPVSARAPFRSAAARRIPAGLVRPARFHERHHATVRRGTAGRLDAAVPGQDRRGLPRELDRRAPGCQPTPNSCNPTRSLASMRSACAGSRARSRPMRCRLRVGPCRSGCTS